MVQVVDFDSGGFGRIGKGFAQGISEALPKELNRMSLSRGLERFNKESEAANLAGKPFSQSEAFAKMAPYMIEHPEIARQFGEIIRSEAKGRGLTKQAQPGKEPSPFPKEEAKAENKEPSTGLTSREGVEATLKPTIPRTYPQVVEAAGKLYNDNRQLYPTAESAIQAVMQEEQQNQNINQALQGQRQNELMMQQSIKQGLEQKKNLLNALVPGIVYSDIENKAMNAVKPIEEGGEGLTDTQAIQKYGNEADQISKEYANLGSIGKATIFSDNKDMRSAISSIQKTFEDRGDTDNFYKTLQSPDAQNLSNRGASVFAYPLKNEKPLENAVKSLPKISEMQVAKKQIAKGDLGKGSFAKIKEKIDSKTLKESKRLAPLLGVKGSPLAVGEYLSAKGYNPVVWRDYLREHKNDKDLNLSDWQKRQIDETISPIPNMNDFWLFGLSGLNELLEQ